MDFITQWTERLIIIILIATLLELFLPENRFQPYIKIVMGLLILLIMLNPLVNLFHLRMPSLNQIHVPVQGNKIEKNKIKKLKSEIDQQNAAYIHKQMVVQLKDIVNKEVHDAYGYYIVNIDMKTAASIDSQTEQMDHLTVYLSKNEAVGDKRSDSGVLPIKTVTINENGSGNVNTEKMAISPKDQKQLIHLLASKWGVDPSVIEIKSVEGKSAS